MTIQPNTTNYYPTSEDFLFIAKTLNENPTKYSNGDRAASRLSHFISIYGSDKTPMLINGCQVVAHREQTKAIINSWINMGCPNPPQINFNDIKLLDLLYYEDKPFIFKFHEHFVSKGFDVMELFSEISSRNHKNYQLWNLFPHYIAYIHSPKSQHKPKPEHIFSTIDSLTSINKKYSIPYSIGLLLYCTKYPEIYSTEKTIDLTAKFTNGQKSIPQGQIKKYESLLNICSSLNTTYWNSVVLKNRSLKDRLKKKEVNTYDSEDCIARHWTLDSHNLSSKNSNFSVKIMKDNYDNLSQVMKKDSSEIVINYFYQHESSIIKMNVIVKDSLEGKKEIEKYQTMVDLVFQNCCKNNLLREGDIQKYLDNLNLMSNLEENLSNNDNPKIKHHKI